jgi:hypothetical protein
MLTLNNTNKAFSNIYFIVAVFSINVYLAARASGLKQCCDAVAYFNESVYIFTGQKNIAQAHNYGYPLFVKFITALGADTTRKISIVTVLILLSLACYFVKTCKTYFNFKSNSLYFFVLVFCLPISYGYSGFLLTEALIAPLFFLLLNLFIVNNFATSEKTRMFTYLLIMATASFAWMVRPALLWLPIFLLVWLSFTGKTNFAQIIIKITLGFFTILFISLPQYVLVTTQPQKILRPWLDGVLHLNLAQGQSEWSRNIYRYATNLSTCGAPPFNFSPNDLTYEQAMNNQYDYSIFEVFKSFLLHLFSGWDALPGPSYIQEISYFPWILVTLFSGFFLSGPLILLYLLFFKRVLLRTTEKKFVLLLLALFLASQLLLLNTATEFRFNLFGWMISGFIWIFMTSFLKVHIRIKLILLMSFILTIIVLVIGQYTLNLSDVWKNCT